jgi:hypothetical protein
LTSDPHIPVAGTVLRQLEREYGAPERRLRQPDREL